jgi:hypothetical protein
MRLKLSRASFVTQLCAGVVPSLLLASPALSSEPSLSDFVRRAVVRGAQVADQADATWQQLAGEVVPSWQKPQELSPLSVPPSLLDAEFAEQLLSLPLVACAACGGEEDAAALVGRLPAARQDAVLLYSEDGAAPEASRGTARRSFPRALATAIADGGSTANTTMFGFEAYVRWRVLQAVLSDERSPAERARLQRCFSERLGRALLRGPLSDASLPPMPPQLSSPQTRRQERTLLSAVDGCSALLNTMQQKGLFSRVVLQKTLGSGTDLFDASDWAFGGSTSWQYVISGSALVGASQLAQDRTAATGQGAGLFAGQLVTAPLAAYLEQAGIRARVDEYFLDNRVGLPEARTFSDPRYYSDVLVEIVALEED